MLSTASAPATANPTTNNKVGGGSGVIAGFKGRKRVQQQMQQQQQASSGRRLSPAAAAANAGNEADRAHSVDGSGAGPVPLRRASYAFDHQRHPQQQQKASTPPYHQLNHNHNHVMNGGLMHQHSVPVQSGHHQDFSSDCGSSSGLGGMGTPVKGESGCSGSCSVSASSNNSVAADCSHDSRDSGGPLPSSNSPGAIASTADATTAAVTLAQQNNGHRSLMATATLTPAMVASSSQPQSNQQPTTNNHSPVSSIPTLVQQQPPNVGAQLQQQQQLFSPALPPPGLGLQHHHQHPLQPFGAFVQIPTGQQQQQPPLHPHHAHHQHQFPPSHPALLQHPVAAHLPAAALEQYNALVAAAALLPPAGTPNGNGSSPLYGAPPGQQPQPPNAKQHWNNQGGGGQSPQSNGQAAKQPQQKQGPPPPPMQLPPQMPLNYNAHHQHQQQQLQHQFGRALYTMTCETAALASVGAAAVTAGYHVTLEPCASAPPLIAAPPPPPQQQQPMMGQQQQQQQCTPPPGFGQETAAMPPASQGENDASPAEGIGGAQQPAGDQQEQNADGGLPPMNGPSNGQQQQMSNGPGSANNILPPGVPPEIAAAISGGHDLFVHIHPGDAIALAVGNEIQHIHGPATIRMVSQATPPSAIPMTVPQGHVVQQLLDRQGYLSHIIMSQEMPPPASGLTPPGPLLMGAQQPIGSGQHQQQHQAGQQQHMHAQQQQQRHHSFSHNNTLQPHHGAHQSHQSSPSPQKSTTQAGGGSGGGGRYRPSPSSSASPPQQQQHLPHHQQQHFVLPPSYEQAQQQQQFYGGGQSAEGTGYGQQPNPLNKWSPRGGGQFHQQQQGGYGGRRNHQHQQPMAGTSNAHGFYMDQQASGTPQLLGVNASLGGPSSSPFGQLLESNNEYGGQPLHHHHPLQQQQPPQQQQQFVVGPSPAAAGGPFPAAGTQQPQPAQQQQQETVATPMSIEEDEKERLREALSSLQPPMVTRVADRDADVVWQELDTSEAAASVPGFPEINQSEFVYQLILYEQGATASVCYKTDANSGNVLHLQRLRPSTDYMICIRADLPGHAIIGHPSAYTAFRTHCSRPDTPQMPKVCSRTATGCQLQWRTPNCNGAPILSFCLQMAKGGSQGGKSASGSSIASSAAASSAFETVYDGPHEQAMINGLESHGVYRFRLSCRNECGHSDFSPQLNVYPPVDRGAGQQHHHFSAGHPPHLFGSGKASLASSSPSSSSTILHQPPTLLQKPPPPTVLSVTNKAAKLSWNEVTSHDYSNVTLEMSDFSVRGTPHFAPIPVECYASSGTFANVTGLQTNREYRFRLAVHTVHGGEMLHSDFVAVRTRQQEQSHHRHYEGQQPAHEKRPHGMSPSHQQQSAGPFEEEQQQPLARTSPAVQQKGGTAHQQKKFGQQQSAASQQTKKQSVTQQQQQQKAQHHGQQQKTQSHQQQQQPSVEETDIQQQQTAASTVEKSAAKKKEEQPQKEVASAQPQPANCSAPKFSAVTSESAKVGWRLLTPGGANSPKKANSLDSNQSQSKETTTSKSSTTGGGQPSGGSQGVYFELQRVDRQQPLIIYSGNEAEYEMRGLRPVEHLQLRVRAVLFDTEGRRFEGEWSQVGSACTLCATPSAPRNLRLAEPDSPTTTICAIGSEEEERASSKKSSVAGHHHGHGQSIELCWDPPVQLNGGTITEYTVHLQRFPLPEEGANSSEKPLEERLLGSTISQQFHTPRLQPAQRWLFTVVAHNEAGQSPRSEPFEHCSPPGVPESPRDFHAEALSTSELQLSWTEPISSNGAPVSSYHINCYKLYNTRNQTAGEVMASGGRQRQLISQQIVPGSQRLLLVQSLETETDYELVLQAENSVGKSGRQVLRCATLAEPPAPPELALSQATANQLKLRWNPAASNTGEPSASSVNHYYYLERENENGTYSPVYEGDLRTAKVKGLRERSIHHFRIRAAVAKGLMLGQWSKRFSFQTTRLPPPAPKQAPIATELSPDLFQLEWNSIRSAKETSMAAGDEQPQTASQPATEQHQFIYRVQLAPKLASSAKEKSTVEVWKTVYEGPNTQCTVPVPNAAQQTRQVRLFLVQQFLAPGSDSAVVIEECVSAPSPATLLFAQKSPNESPKKRPLQGGKLATGPSTSSTIRGRQQQAAVHYPTPKEGKVSMYKRLRRFGSWMKKTVSEKDCALIVLAIFVVLAFGIAILLNNYYLN